MIRLQNLGSNLALAAAQACKVATVCQQDVKFSFREVELIAHHGDEPSAVIATFQGVFPDEPLEVIHMQHPGWDQGQFPEAAEQACRVARDCQTSVLLDVGSFDVLVAPGTQPATLVALLAAGHVWHMHRGRFMSSTPAPGAVAPVVP